MEPEAAGDFCKDLSGRHGRHVVHVVNGEKKPRENEGFMGTSWEKPRKMKVIIIIYYYYFAILNDQVTGEIIIILKV